MCQVLHVCLPDGNKPMCYPQQLGRSWMFLYWNPPEHCLLWVYRNLPEPHPLSAPQPSGTSSALCTGTLRNLISHLHRNPREPCLLSAPEPSRTIHNLISHLHRNHPEPHQPSAPEPSGTSSPFCTRALRNPPEPSPEPGGCSCAGSHQSCSGLKTHSKFCCWGKRKTGVICGTLQMFPSPQSRPCRACSSGYAPAPCALQ